MRATRWALPALAVLLLSSCFQSFTLLRVNKDGSGTLEERFLFGNRFADMLRSVSEPDEAEPEEPAETVEITETDEADETVEPAGEQARVRDPQSVDLERLRARAAEMGPGVQLELAEPVRTESGAGYRAVFRFADINLLELRFNPAETLAEASQGESSAPQPIRFRFTRGPTSGLEILFPPAGQDGQSSGPPAAGEPQDGTLHMLRQIYGEMKIRLALEVGGQITESNAAYQDGSTVTLLDLDFGLLMQDDQAFRRIAAAQPRGLEDLKLLAADLPALKIENRQSVLVRFR
jgi:hypothetical protein